MATRIHLGVLAAILLASAGFGSSAFAQNGDASGCKSQFETLHKELLATGLDPLATRDQFPPPPWSDRARPRTEDPKKVLKGKEGHVHTVADLNVMRHHLVTAKDLCEHGQDHEAMLHMDVVRAIHKLPEIQQPLEHQRMQKSQ